MFGRRCHIHSSRGGKALFGDELTGVLGTSVPLTSVCAFLIVSGLRQTGSFRKEGAACSSTLFYPQVLSLVCKWLSCQLGLGLAVSDRKPRIIVT